MKKLIKALLWPFKKLGTILWSKTFWGIFIPLIGLSLTLSPRPSIVFSVDVKNSGIQYVSAELKNAGNAPAFDMKYNLFPEIKTVQGATDIPNPQDPLFHKSVLQVGQVYQGGRMTGVTPDMRITELLLRYEVSYCYSVVNIPFLDRWKRSTQIQGQLLWNGKKWDVR